MKNTSKNPRNQVKSRRNLKNAVKYLSQDAIADIFSDVKTLYPSDKRVLNVYFKIRGLYRCPKPRQKEVARLAGVSDKTVYRVNKRLSARGYIQVNGYDGDTSIINLSPIFFREDVKQQLKYMFPNIVDLPHEQSVLRRLWLFRKNAGTTGIMHQYDRGIYVSIIYTLKQEKEVEKISGRGGEDIVLGAVPSHIAKKNRDTCCWDDTVFGECDHVCTESSPTIQKWKGDGSPAARSRVPAESSQDVTVGLASPLMIPSLPVYEDYEELGSRSGLPCRNAFAKDTHSLNKFTDSHSFVVVSQSSATRRKGYCPPSYDTSAYKPFYERVKFTRERKEYWEINKPSNDEEAVRRNERALEYQRILGIS